MRKKICFLVLAFTLLVQLAPGQSKAYFDLTPRDGFNTDQPDTLGEKTYQFSDSIWLVARDYEEYFVVGNTVMRVEGIGQVEAIDTFDFNRDGTLEYMIQRYQQSGNGSWDSGWEENYLTLDIYDVKNSFLLLTETLFFEHRDWHHTVVDEPDSIPVWERDVLESDSIHDCDEQSMHLDRSTGLLCFKPLY